MNLFTICAIIITLSAIGSYINLRWLKLPNSISLLLFSLALSTFMLLTKHFNWLNFAFLPGLLEKIDFNEIIFHGMLAFLLFAGAMQIQITDLKKAQVPIMVTAFISTIISTGLIGVFFFYAAHFFTFSVSWLDAFLFGAILSPTDPIAVLSIIKKMQAPQMIETTIVGESLFNDGVAIVLFLTLLEISHPAKQVGWVDVLVFGLREAGGGIAFGGVMGFLAARLMSTVNDFDTQLLITLALATGGYALAEQLGFSAPLAMVIAGIIIGNRKIAARDESIKHYLDLFWEAIDNVLNTTLFFLIGLEMVVITINYDVLLLSLACIPIALAARYLSIALPLHLLKPFHAQQQGTSMLLTWGGLRGALSIAMALSLTSNGSKELFLPCIYAVVVFSIAVQGLSFAKMLKYYLRNAAKT